MVEMVFVLPVLLMVLFSIAQFGLMFNRWLTLSNAVREGVRAGVTWDDECDSDDVEQRVTDTVLDYATAGHLALTEDDLVISGICGGRGSNLTVTANYSFAMRIPYAELASVPLDYSATMRNE